MLGKNKGTSARRLARAALASPMATAIDVQGGPASRSSLALVFLVLINEYKTASEKAAAQTTSRAKSSRAASDYSGEVGSETAKDATAGGERVAFTCIASQRQQLLSSSRRLLLSLPRRSGASRRAQTR